MGFSSLFTFLITFDLVLILTSHRGGIEPQCNNAHLQIYQIYQIQIRVQKCPLFCIFDLNGVHFLEFKGHFCLQTRSCMQYTDVYISVHPGSSDAILLTKMSYQRTQISQSSTLSIKREYMHIFVYHQANVCQNHVHAKDIVYNIQVHTLYYTTGIGGTESLSHPSTCSSCRSILRQTTRVSFQVPVRTQGKPVKSAINCVAQAIIKAFVR